MTEQLNSGVAEVIPINRHESLHEINGQPVNLAELTGVELHLLEAQCNERAAEAVFEAAVVRDWRMRHDDGGGAA